MSLVKRDSNIIWHPFTQEKTANLPIAITKGEGSYLFDEQNNRYLDLISSWWVNIHGHAHPKICEAIYNQARKLEHVIFAGFTHEPAILLCEKLQTILPSSLSRFFFSDNGSTAVEVALKMAHQYWFNKGNKERNLYISFDGGYHGDTFGAMSVGKKSHFHDPFNALLFDIISVPFPSTWQGDTEVTIKESSCLKYLQQQLEEKGEYVSAIILEPIVQGAIGMKMCRVEFVREVIALVKQYNILVIYDEVMTGFCRLGTYFAAEQIGINPDFICISKGITGGFLPLALTVTSQNIYENFLSDKWDKAFAHGHSYTANPIACSAAIASFELLITQTTQDNIQNICKAHAENIEILKNKLGTLICHVRCKGTIMAFEVNSQNDLNEYFKKVFLERGLLIRPLDNTIYVIPPYSTTRDELLYVYDTLVEVIQNANNKGMI